MFFGLVSNKPHGVASTFLLLFLVGCAISGCGQIFGSAHAKAKPALTSDAVERSRNGEAAADSPKEPPLDIGVDQAFIEKEQLRVRARVTAKTQLDPKLVRVTVSGLHEGNVVEEQEKNLAEEFPFPVLEAGKAAVIHFALPAESLSEYQVKCSWQEPGSDQRAVVSAQGKPAVEGVVTAAVPLQTPSAPTIASEKVSPRAEPVVISGGRGLILENIGVESREIPCGSKSCDKLFTVYGELLNDSGRTVRNISLALGLFWKDQGASLGLPADSAGTLSENEETVELGELELPPGMSKRMKIEVDRAVPQLPGGSFVPHLRVWKYSE